MRVIAAVALAGASLAACATTPAPTTSVTQAPRPHIGPARAVPATMRPYQVGGVWYAPREDPDYEAVGTASWYGAQFHNRRTADGEVFDMDAPSGAHKTLPLPCIVEVTNLENGRRLQVRINDRGPFVDGRIIDLSREAARRLGFYDKGTARVQVRYIGPASLVRPEDGLRYASTPAPITQPAPVSIDEGLKPAARPVEHLSGSQGAPVRIQAAAFADRSAAERAAARLADQGETTIDTIQRAGGVLYRVTVRCVGGGGDDAGSALDRIAAAGFPGARVLGF